MLYRIVDLGILDAYYDVKENYVGRVIYSDDPPEPSGSKTGVYFSYVPFMKLVNGEWRIDEQGTRLSFHSVIVKEIDPDDQQHKVQYLLTRW